MIYLGTYLTAEMMEGFEAEILRPAGIEPLVAELPEGLELSLRESEDRRLLFVLNTTHEPIGLPDLPAGTALIDDSDDGSLPAYGVVVVKLD